MRITNIIHSKNEVNLTSASGSIEAHVTDEDTHVELELADGSLIICESDNAYYNLIGIAEIYEALTKSIYLDALMENVSSDLIYETEINGKKVTIISEFSYLDYKYWYIQF